MVVAGRINAEDVQALRERADIAAVISDYTALRRAGSRLKGLCPFHAEKTPSFTVDPAKGVYHCFGCGAGGDVYGFLQQAEALTFPEAVERLARIEGYTLRYEELSPGQRRALGERTRLAEVVAEARAFYSAQLFGDDGAAARAYLGRRGVRREAAEHFGLGWAPDRWDALSRHLLAQGFTAKDVVTAGLATQGQRGPIDRFRGRVVFPIYDAGGRDVVGFGGRILPDVELRTGPRDGQPPKYINSPETPVYRKSQTLYALNWARAEIQRRDTALVVEGYMDVIGLHLAGVRHVVATCGTALTIDHFRLLEKFARRIVLALDADDAGYAAAERARAIAEEAGIREVGVLPLPPGQDPADLAAAGPARVEEALAATKTAIEFQLEHILRDADVSSPEAQVEAYRKTFPLLKRVKSRELRYRYVRDVVAPRVRISADVIEAELGHIVPRVGADLPTAIPGVPAPGDVAHPRPHDPQLQLERSLLQVALQAPELLPPSWQKVTAEDFRAPLSRQLFTALRAAPPGDLDAVLRALPDDETRSRVRALALSELTVPSEVSKVAELVARFRARALEREHAELRERLTRIHEQLDAVERRALMTRLYELERQRRDLLEGRDA